MECQKDISTEADFDAGDFFYDAVNTTAVHVVNKKSLCIYDLWHIIEHIEH